METKEMNMIQELLNLPILKIEYSKKYYSSANTVVIISFTLIIKFIGLNINK